MDIYLKKEKDLSIYEYSLIYGGLGILILLVSRFLPLSSFPLLCPFKALTGIPGPTCGSTRAFVHFAHLDLAGAFGMNPLFSAILVLGAMLFLYSISALLFRPLRLEIKLDKKEKTLLRFGAVLAITLNWVYLIIAGI